MAENDAPAPRKLRSAAELYREASAEQAKGLRMLASQNREALEILGALAQLEPQREKTLARAIALAGGVERALLAIAAELERAGSPA